MGKDSRIEWTDHTFNPWWGCSKISPGCDHCYAESLAKRFGHDVWGPGKPRRLFGRYHWDEPCRWNAAAAMAGKRARVFCGSMCDIFDNEVSLAARCRLWLLIEVTPHLDWLLLTKRIGNAAAMVPPLWRERGWPPNVWAGASFINQPEVDRDMAKLLALPARVHFGSFEPLLGPIDLRNVYCGETLTDALDGGSEIGVIDAGDRLVAIDPVYRETGKLAWVIIGGESGLKARPMHPDWARGLRDQCAAAGVPFFFKQWGEWAPVPTRDDLPAHPRMVKRGDLMLCADGRGHVIGTGLSSEFEDAATPIRRLGKKAAGRLLDGREWNEVPA